MRTDGKWISDSNYAEDGKRVIPAGTPITVQGAGRYRIYVQVSNRRQALGNDYSRDLSMEDFGHRYIVSEDPRAKIASFDPKVRKGIATSRVVLGMSREQVLMAMGYPISSENPHLDVRMWRYWYSSFSPFTVHFDGSGRVTKVDTDDGTLLKVLLE